MNNSDYISLTKDETLVLFSWISYARYRLGYWPPHMSEVVHKIESRLAADVKTLRMQKSVADLPDHPNEHT